MTASLVHACRQAGVWDERVLDAVRAVDRTAFLPSAQKRSATRDAPLPIGDGQTTSQPSLIDCWKYRGQDMSLEELERPPARRRAGTTFEGLQSSPPARTCSGALS